MRQRNVLMVLVILIFVMGTIGSASAGKMKYYKKKQSKVWTDVTAVEYSDGIQATYVTKGLTNYVTTAKITYPDGSVKQVTIYYYQKANNVRMSAYVNNEEGNGVLIYTKTFKRAKVKSVVLAQIKNYRDGDILTTLGLV